MKVLLLLLCLSTIAFAQSDVSQQSIAPGSGLTDLPLGVSKEAINEAVKRHVAEIRACYDAALRRKPTLAGKVIVAFTVEPNGQVSRAAVIKSTAQDDIMHSCFRRVIKSVRFPKANAITEVSAYPFYLKPVD